MTTPGRLPGALVVSLDFELAWGVADRLRAGSDYSVRLEGARVAIPRMLSLFREYEVRGTWAVVGSLFASSRREMERYRPSRRPRYADRSLSVPDEDVGRDVDEDPLHFAPDLVEAIHGTSGQEIASHTFSHFYCGERGQDADDFRADLEAAVAIARSRGIELRSIVLPRNQHNPEYDDVLLECGFTAYRGNPGSAAWRFDDARQSRSPGKRALRWLDDYVDLAGPATTPWSDVLQPSGLSDVRASRFVRLHRPGPAALEALRFRRLRRCMEHAAENGEILHLWWHPHNVGIEIDENMEGLRRLLETFDACRRSHGMASLTMQQVDERARSTARASRPGGASGSTTPANVA